MFSYVLTPFSFFRIVSTRHTHPRFTQIYNLKSNDVTVLQSWLSCLWIWGVSDIVCRSFTIQSIDQPILSSICVFALISCPWVYSQFCKIIPPTYQSYVLCISISHRDAWTIFLRWFHYFRPGSTISHHLRLSVDVSRTHYWSALPGWCLYSLQFSQPIVEVTLHFFISVLWLGKLAVLPSTLFQHLINLSGWINSHGRMVRVSA
jgi:hypothetical protein